MLMEAGDTWPDVTYISHRVPPQSPHSVRVVGNGWPAKPGSIVCWTCGLRDETAARMDGPSHTYVCLTRLSGRCFSGPARLPEQLCAQEM